ncbi:hypothetical protein IMSHALPRED_000307 [Imshaugia aleurites]|uniref:Beta-lactamase-related domain-containing protein n=1 Tax=Imshaugia aleurites TaxID=172621 RepID=A0A8H3ETF3_9LECA|nr:hypothetical protein IMSHALPRED_000307 [Imshaugia aleurites]
MRFSSYLDILHPFRARWLYNNGGYGITDEISEKLSGEAWGRFLRERILNPLWHAWHNDQSIPGYGECRKGVHGSLQWHSVSPTEAKASGWKLLAGAAGVQSNVRDLLAFYKNLDAARQQGHDGLLRKFPTILSPHISLEPEPSPQEVSYGFK